MGRCFHPPFARVVRSYREQMAHLIVKSTSLAGRRLPLPGRAVVLGRSLDVDVPLPEETVSRRHALIEETAEGFRISDLGSSNGTWVMDRRLGEGERVPLPLGAPFRLGAVDIVLAPDEVIEEEGVATTVPVAAPVARPAPPRVPELEARPRAGRAKPGGARPRASPAQRAARRRARRDAVRWVGVIVGVLLLALAGLVLARIAGRTRGPERPPRDEEKPAAEKPSKPEIRPLSLPR